MGDICLGTVVDRQRDGSQYLLPPHLCHVSSLWYGRELAISISMSSFNELTWANAYSLSHRRGDLAEMTALYLIPIVAVVIAASSGSLIGSVLENQNDRLWTLIISYIYWGLSTPLSWIILTIYFLRMSTEKPIQREVIVTLLLPIGPLSLSGFS